MPLGSLHGASRARARRGAARLAWELRAGRKGAARGLHGRSARRSAARALRRRSGVPHERAEAPRGRCARLIVELRERLAQLARLRGLCAPWGGFVAQCARGASGCGVRTVDCPGLCGSFLFSLCAVRSCSGFHEELGWCAW